MPIIYQYHCTFQHLVINKYYLCNNIIVAIPWFWSLKCNVLNHVLFVNDEVMWQVSRFAGWVIMVPCCRNVKCIVLSPQPALKDIQVPEWSATLGLHRNVSHYHHINPFTHFRLALLWHKGWNPRKDVCDILILKAW